MPPVATLGQRLAYGAASLVLLDQLGRYSAERYTFSQQPTCCDGALRQVHAAAAAQHVSVDDLVARGVQRLLRASSAQLQALRDPRSAATLEPMDPPYVPDVQFDDDAWRARVHLALSDAPAGAAVTLFSGTVYSPWDAFWLSIFRPSTFQENGVRRPYDGCWLVGDPIQPGMTERMGQLLPKCPSGSAGNVALWTVPLGSSVPQPLVPFLPLRDARAPRYRPGGPLATAVVALRDIRAGEELCLHC
eukprot:EG_transcript_22379